MTQNICGVDVSKATLDAFIHPAGVYKAFANDASGVAALAAFCRAHGAPLAVMEASGACERFAFLGLWRADQPAARVNPRFVRRFAESMGALEKTDKLDAQMIAHYAQVKGVKPEAPASEKQQELNALFKRLAQISHDVGVNKQRLSAAHDTQSQSDLRQVNALLERQARRIEGEIASLIDDDPLWGRLNDALREVKGVANRTVARLLAELPEIGLISGKAVAKLTGLAPINDDSGKRQGKRHVRGGRAGLRSLLFLIGGIAAKYHPGLKACKERLQNAGKPKMVIRIALARKLIVILNAKARDARCELAKTT